MDHQQRKHTSRPGLPAAEQERPERASGSLMQLQRTVGNHTLSRMLRRAPDKTPAPDKPGGWEKEPFSRTMVVASITGIQQGKFKGNSELQGHEDKIEFESLSIIPGKHPKMAIVTVTGVYDRGASALQEANQTGELLRSAEFIILGQRGKDKVEVITSYKYVSGHVTNFTTYTNDGIPRYQATLDLVEEEKKK